MFNSYPQLSLFTKVTLVMGLPLFQTVEAEFGQRTFLGRGVEPI